MTPRASLWDRRIERAGELSKQHPAAAELLAFYQAIARFQKNLQEKIGPATEHDLATLLPHFPPLIALVKQKGSPALRKTAEELEKKSHSDWIELLSAVWQHEPESKNLTNEQVFFANALLQPYAECLAERTVPPMNDNQVPVCPFCGSRPQVAALRPEGDGAKRSLICSMCATEWNFKRVACPNCGEENKDKLPVYIAEELDYVRVDACDTCRTYLKSIDMTKNGHAVPMVDEIATISLNLWAEENNYAKFGPNLFGV
jgi:FdhE protein